MSSGPGQQPFLHDLVSTLAAPMVVLSGPDGQIEAGGAHGIFAFDRRVISKLTVAVDGERPVGVAQQLVDPSGARFQAVLRRSGDPIPDPTVLLTRSRRTEPDRVTDTIEITSRAQEDVELTMTVQAASDLATMEEVKLGVPTTHHLGRRGDDGLVWSDADRGLTAVLRCRPAPQHGKDGALNWCVHLSRGQSWQVELAATLADSQSQPPFSAAPTAPWCDAAVSADDPRLSRLVDRGLADLRALLLTDDGEPFVSAGSPWFLTLFGRDALWAARLVLPWGTEVAMGTLRTLARRQGSRVNAETEEEPGKILHEVRRERLSLGDLSLPPVYYGTVDATALWVTLLAESWRWGAPSHEIEALLPHAVRALSWLQARSAASDDGFIRYHDYTGHGLANQGWKDSGDSIQWADGRLASSPIALSEVQAYAYQAAVAGAELLEAFGWDGAARWRDWAAQHQARFRARFWVRDDRGRYPAIALDRDGRAVDGVASNMGHLLGTGLLDPAEAAMVAERLSGPDMDSGRGLRTLSSDSPRFNPLSYHGGAVWPHDTVIAARGLLLEGHAGPAISLLAGLVAAAEAFDYRLPELYGGYAASTDPVPVAYPAACRPQAWSAAAGVAAAYLPMGLVADGPSGRLDARPVRATPWGRVQVEGLRLGSRSASVVWDRGGGVQVRLVGDSSSSATSSRASASAR